MNNPEDINNNWNDFTKRQATKNTIIGMIIGIPILIGFILLLLIFKPF